MTKWHYAVPCIALACALGINLAAIFLHTDAQASANRAGLVVQYKDGRVFTRCVTFAEPEISGYDLLRRANLPVIADVSGGGSICKIGNTGCNFPAQRCFCDCQDLNQTCIYWIYYFQANNAWKYSQFGAALQKVTNGSVNGWVYGAGSASSRGVMPPLMTLDQICGNATEPPTVSSQATTAPVATRAATATIASTQAGAPVVGATATALESATPGATVPSATTVTMALTLAPTQFAATMMTATQSQPAVATSTALPAPSATAITPPAATPPESTTASSTGTGRCLIFGGMAATLAAVLLITRRNTGGAKP